MSRDRESSGGFYTVVFAITLPLFIGALGLGIDVSRWWWAQGQLQNAADAAAFAGAKDLNSTGSGRVKAGTSASTIATQYKIDGTLLASSEVVEQVAGEWDFETKTFTSSGISDVSANALRVAVRRQNVPSYFSAFLPAGHTANTLTATATAVAGGARQVPCAAPVVVGACALTYDSKGKLICPTKLSFQNGITSIGLTLPDGSSPVNGNKAKPYFEEALANPDSCSSAAAAGGMLHLQNGNDLAHETVDDINDATDDGADPVSLIVPVVDVACRDNGEATYNQSAPIVGFIRLRLVGARWTGAAPAKVAAACPSLGKKNICITEDCGPIDAPAGGTIQPDAAKVYLVQ